eukprot:15317294-Ditylum_brightwellii.AAC.1
MGDTVKKLPAIKLFDQWFDEHIYFALDKAPIKISGILDLTFSTLNECTCKRSNNEKVEEFDDKVKELIAYSTNDKSKAHYQHYKKQYQEYTKKHSKL